MRSILLALFLTGCTGSIPVSLTESAKRTDNIDELLDDAGLILGYPIVVVDSDYGSVSLSIAQPHAGITGEAFRRGGCRREVKWAAPDALTIAHEIAHTLGLDHSDDPENLMFPDVMGYELTEDQEDDMALSLSNLNSCTARPG